MKIFGDFYENLPGEEKKRYLRTKKDYEDDVYEESEKRPGFKFDDNWTKKRLIWFYLFSFLIFIFLLSRLWILQITQGSRNRELAEGNRIRIQNITAPRGIIYDKAGNILVRNFPSFSLEIYPADLPAKAEDREILYQNVSNLINLPVDEIKKTIGEDLHSLQPRIILDNINRDLALSLKEKMANFPAFQITEQTTRSYMEGYGLAHILGYVGRISPEELKDKSSYLMTDFLGKSGLEAYYEEELKGPNGKKQVEVDANGKIVRILANEEAKPGQNLVLSLDLDLQRFMYNRLNEVAQTKRQKAAAVAINPKTGEILASVSIPDYNNNIFTTLPSNQLQQAFESLNSDPNEPLFNRVISGLYPPGSTIKPVMAAAGLQEGVISDKTTILDPGQIVVKNQFDPNITYVFTGWKPGGLGLVNVYKAIALSCDTFFYAVGGGWDKISGLGIRKIDEYFSKFGLGSKTGIDLAGESTGLLPSPAWKEEAKKEVWYQGDTYHVSIGQGDLLVTPLQLANTVATIANGGRVIKPHFVTKITDAEGRTIKEISPEVIQSNFVNPEYINMVRAGMRQAITSGTARELASLPVAVAGKTGTAQFDNNQQTHAWFTAFAPYDDPKIALVVLVEGGGEGHETAVPVARDILNYYFTRK